MFEADCLADRIEFLLNQGSIFEHHSGPFHRGRLPPSGESLLGGIDSIVHRGGVRQWGLGDNLARRGIVDRAGRQVGSFVPFAIDEEWAGM